ncbi:hypothetical protein [Nesterenkonia sp. NBAIMH1]|uniref:hypothetical protein n=1 Tax=Nesterenkonia sp. NBAIMH1 TaxID=2600320 RepID=UPI0011B68573|nr:hypothetical protein [Nesterenkonia sp. NBAIMH1]
MTPRAAPRVHARRQLATVLIDGASPVGLRVAEHLARSGLGTLLLRDAAPVGAADLRQAAGALGFRALHQGRRREDAAVEELKLVGADAAVLAAPEDFGTAGVDLHIALGDSLEKLLGRVRPAVEEGQGRCRW